jgi:hypothetical protein
LLNCIEFYKTSTSIYEYQRVKGVTNMKKLMSICSKILGVSPGSLNYSEDSECNRESYRRSENERSTQKATDASLNSKNESKENALSTMDWDN